MTHMQDLQELWNQVLTIHISCSGRQLEKGHECRTYWFKY